MTKLLNELTHEEITENLEMFFAKEANDIVSSISHDIKNPLGIIDLSLGLLEDKIEPLLESADEALVKKIRTFINNINSSISRCELILENTQTIRAISKLDEVCEVKLHKFFEDFYIFAKPSLKRSKVSLENAIDSDLTTSLNKQTCARAIILFIKNTFEKIKSDKNLSSKVLFDGSSLILETWPMNKEDKILYNNEDTIDYQILKTRFSKICNALEITYSVDAQDKSYITKLSWPKS